MAQVLVIGASRGVGLAVVRRALGEGHDVRALARSADKIDIDDPRLEKVSGDALSAREVRAALEGIDAVIQTLGVTARPDTIVAGTKVFSKATRLLVEAMEAVGVARLIALTGFGTGDSRNQGGCLWDLGFNLFLGRIYDDKNVQEHLIRHSSLAWTIARPVILTDGPARSTYRVIVDPRDWRGGFIARGDVAEFLVEQVTSERYLRQAPVLIG
ncbi:MAG: SDR family oxidoreductase [Pseudomonadota bacterium]